MSSEPAITHPPRAQMALRVGVTGRREIAEANRSHVANAALMVLKHIRTTVAVLGEPKTLGYSSDPVALRLLSPLAKGADRIVAEAGLQAGFDLECPLPYPREQYERDFPEPENLEEFRRLLGRASSVLELDGTPDAEDHLHKESGYLSVGRCVIGNSDLLISVWEGTDDGKLAGTGHITREAMAAGLIVVRINPKWAPGEADDSLIHIIDTDCYLQPDWRKVVSDGIAPGCVCRTRRAPV